MITSTLSTFLDVTRLAGDKPSPVPAPSNADFLSDTAKVLAQVYAAAASAPEIAVKSRLSLAEVLKSLAWLSQANLVDLRGCRACATAEARVALSAP
jgi:hypothetical protein